MSKIKLALTAMKAWPWLLIGKIALVLAVGYLFYWLVISPRMEASRLREEAAAEELKQAEDALVVSQAAEEAQRNVDQAYLEAAGEQSVVRARRIQRQSASRERTAGRIAQHGDPQVGPVLGGFFQDLAAEEATHEAR